MQNRSNFAYYQFKKIGVSEDQTIMKFVCVNKANENAEIEKFRNCHKAIVIWYDSAKNKFSFDDPSNTIDEPDPSRSFRPKYKLFDDELVGAFGANGDQFLWVNWSTNEEYADLIIATGQERSLFLEKYMAGELDDAFELLGGFADNQVAEIF